MPDEFTLAEVKEAALKYMLDTGEAEGYKVAQGVARILGTGVFGAGGWKKNLADKLSGQINRALNAYAAEGKLVKLSRGDHDPLGNYVNNVKFYTTEAWAHVLEHAAAHKAQQSDLRQRWEAVYDKLTARDIPMEQRPGQPVQLSLLAWEKLLNMAGMAASEEKPIVYTHAQADKLMALWAARGRPSHVFAGNPETEQFCRECAGGPDGIQHIKGS